MKPEAKPGSDRLPHGSNKLSFIRYFFALGAFGALLAAYFDRQQGYVTVSAIEATVGVLGLVFLLYSHRFPITNVVLNATVVVVYSLFAAAAFTQMDAVISLVWVPAYPIVFFFLTRYRTGLFWSALTLLTITVAYIIHPYLRETERIPLQAFLQTCSAYIFVGALAFFYEVVRSRQERQLQQQADYDYLTGVYNRRGLTRSMATEINRVARYGTRLSFLLMDIDDFKQINDRHGHKTGDRVLQAICRLTRESIRQSDVLARWGGEEFAILLPEAGLQQAGLLADKLRAIIAAHEFDGVGHITVSIGVAQYRLPEPEDDMLQRADMALYRAKGGNKNRVELAPAS
jgi:diguanylate cyclase (GGDEF)-like protein